MKYYFPFLRLKLDNCSCNLPNFPFFSIFDFTKITMSQKVEHYSLEYKRHLYQSENFVDARRLRDHYTTVEGRFLFF